MLILLVAVVNFLVILVIFTQLIVGFKKTGKLDNCGPPGASASPKVSIIMTACNEEDGIEQAVHTMFQQQYENYEVIVVDDRSTDETPIILGRLQTHYPELSVIRIDHLPEGWLGKVHAMQVGAEQSSGEFLLFTDGDVILEPSTIARAIGHADTNNLDHLTLIFRNSTRGLLLNSLIIDSGTGLFLLLKPWLVKKQESRYFIGVGAFNLIRAAAYRAIGGHQQLKTQVVDDLFLGKKLKYAGFHQDCLFAQNHVSVPWYDSIADMVSGLMKNVYSLFHYKILLVIPVILFMVFLTIVPLVGLLFCTGVSQLLFLSSILLRGAGVAMGLKVFNQNLLAVLYTPLTPLISLYIIIRATFITHHLQGVYWRDHFYPLAQLRKGEWLLKGFLKRSGR